MIDSEHTEEEIGENKKERLEVAVDLLEQHPYVVDTWSTDIGMELSADFKTTNSDTDVLEVMLGLEKWNAVLKNDNDNGLIVRMGFDVNEGYHSLEKDGEKYSFSWWANSYDWPMSEYENTIEEVIFEAGYSKE